MLRRLLHALILLPLPTGVALADPVPPDLAALLDIVDAPYQQRDLVLSQLEEALPLFVPLQEQPLPATARSDPYFWSLEGHFGLPIEGALAPGGFVTCARYGRFTLERLQELPSSDRRVFPLMRQAAILHDDATAWPEAAVARLVCLVSWDDGRRVAPLDRDAAELVLSSRFAGVVSTPDPAERPNSVRVFGPGGYMIEALSGSDGPIRFFDRAEIQQVATHQLILMRSFLLGGGV